MESIERTCRFYMHLEKTEELFYSGFNSGVFSTKDKLVFMQSFKSCLVRLLKICVELAQLTQKQQLGTELRKKAVSQFCEILQALSQLHVGYLGHLPRPREPIEIQRFCRMIDKHILNFINKPPQTKDVPKISIYVSEQIGDETFAFDPLSKFKGEELNKIETAYEQLRAETDLLHPLPLKDTLETATLHITIPRVEAGNPCRWPILIHEIAHHLIDEVLFNEKPINQDFEDNLSPEETSAIKPHIDKINLKGWLNESWCDLFATACIGTAFWFSQYSVFISQPSAKMSKTHPPAFIRLYLIKCFLKHRFKGIIWPELGESIGTCQDTLLEIDSINKPETDEPWLVQMLVLMKEYFINHFFPTFGTELNEKIQPFIRHTSEIRETTITTMVGSLSDGLPIPSKKEVTEETYSETPASVQEVLLSAWMYRNIGLKKQLLEAISELPTTADNTVFMEAFSKNVINPLSRFDFSVIRSIQVSEWFDVLVPAEGRKSKRCLRKSDIKVRPVLVDCASDEKVGSVLVDWEIEELIRSNKLHVIPIIDLETQLGSTSLDIRLGTSFQLFYQNQYGIFDSTEPTAHVSLQQSSVLRDLDFLEGLTLFPGQFILGHSMEYLRFPGHIAAEIEGRSSFARLGIEVHMTAGFVDPGYEGVLTYEIYNAGANPVRLYPGTRIAQLRFFTTNVPSKSYDKKPEGKYFGLLAHNNSLQFKDYEIKKIREEKDKYQQRRDYGLI